MLALMVKGSAIIGLETADEHLEALYLVGLVL